MPPFNEDLIHLPRTLSIYYSIFKEIDLVVPKYTLTQLSQSDYVYPYLLLTPLWQSYSYTGVLKTICGSSQLSQSDFSYLLFTPLWQSCMEKMMFFLSVYNWAKPVSRSTQKYLKFALSYNICWIPKRIFINCLFAYRC